MEGEAQQDLVVPNITDHTVHTKLYEFLRDEKERRERAEKTEKDREWEEKMNR